MSSTAGPGDVPSQHPTAVVRSRESHWGRAVISRWWWITLLCAIATVALVVSAMRVRGTKVWVRFQDGHGIQPGDPLRYRGIAVGEVVSVELAENMSSVNIAIHLTAAAEDVARQGSRFWIERPQVSLARVRGLETVVGPKYIAVAPGPPTAPRQHVFEGDENPVTVSGAIEEIRIRFVNGNGLQVGDELRHRGIVVGEVTSVDLDPNLSGVTVRVRLAQSARELARAGSQFWVERPRIGFSGVRGLDTLVGGRYLAVLPAQEDSPPLAEFTGMETAPVAVERAAGGLEVILDSPHRYGVEPGAPVTHRGVEVGVILDVVLAGDAASVELRAYIYPEYRALVRDNTRFWSNSGIDFDIGVGGLHFSADTLATIAAGGVALATPDPEGRVVSTGHRFQLLRRPEDESEWNEWQPRLAVGAAQLPPGTHLPRPLRALFKWHKRTLGIRREQHQEGWVLATDQGQLIAPANMLLPPDGAAEKQGALELAGQEFAIAADAVKPFGQLAIASITLPDSERNVTWPAKSLRAPSELEDGLLIWGARERTTPLPAARMTLADSQWQIDPALPISADAHGAPVVATRDGAVIGILVVSKNQRHVIPISQQMMP